MVGGRQREYSAFSVLTIHNSRPYGRASIAGYVLTKMKEILATRCWVAWMTRRHETLLGGGKRSSKRYGFLAVTPIFFFAACRLRGIAQWNLYCRICRVKSCRALSCLFMPKSSFCKL